MTASDDYNPYAPPAVSSGDAPENPAASAQWRFRLIAFQCIVIVGALAGEFVKIETIIVSGGVFAATGLVISIFGIRTIDRRITCFGVSAVLFALGILFLINFNGWGPQAARRPVINLSIGYSVMALPFAWWLLRRPVPTARVWHAERWSDVGDSKETG